MLPNQYGTSEKHTPNILFTCYFQEGGLPVFSHSVNADMETGKWFCWNHPGLSCGLGAELLEQPACTRAWKMRGGQVSGERMGPVVGSEIPDGESIAQASLPMLGIVCSGIFLCCCCLPVRSGRESVVWYSEFMLCIKVFLLLVSSIFGVKRKRAYPVC